MLPLVNVSTNMWLTPQEGNGHLQDWIQCKVHRLYVALPWKGQSKCINRNMDGKERCHPMNILHVSRDMVPLKIPQSLKIPTKVLREKGRTWRWVHKHFSGGLWELANVVSQYVGNAHLGIGWFELGCKTVPQEWSFRQSQPSSHLSRDD